MYTYIKTSSAILGTIHYLENSKGDMLISYIPSIANNPNYSPWDGDLTFKDELTLHINNL